MVGVYVAKNQKGNSFLSKKDYVYTGQTNLEVMQGAVNYNRYLYKLVKREKDAFKKKNVRILDFGAGIGTYADILKEQGIQVDCVEIDPNGIKILKKNGYTIYKSSKEIKEKYDIVYSFNVLEHVEDDAKLLGEMKSCISEKGVIIVYVPAFKIIFTQLDVLVEHLRRYRISGLQALGDSQSLDIKRIQYCDPVGFILAFIYKIIGGSGNLNSQSVWIFDRILFPISEKLEIVCKRLFGKNALAVYKKQ